MSQAGVLGWRAHWWSTGYSVGASSPAPVSTAAVAAGNAGVGGRVGRARCWVLRDRPRVRLSGRRRGCFFGQDRFPVRVVRGGAGFRPYLENCTVDASIICSCQVDKGTRWMPWHQEPMKDVGACDKPRLVGNQTLTRGFPNGAT